MNINSLNNGSESPKNSFQSDVEGEWMRFHAWMQQSADYRAAA